MKTTHESGRRETTVAVTVVTVCICGACYWYSRSEQTGRDATRNSTQLGLGAVASGRNEEVANREYCAILRHARRAAMRVVGEDASFLARAEALNARLNRDGVDRPSEQRVRRLLVEWARHDPEAAVMFTLRPFLDGSTNDVFLRAADTALAVWIGQDPAAARAFVERQAESAQVAAELGPAMMRAYATAKPREAMEWVRDGFEGDSGSLRPVLARELVMVLNDQGSRNEIERWLSDPPMAESAAAHEAVECYAALLSETDPAAAIAFAGKLPRGTMSRGLGLQTALFGIASRSPGQAYTWITRMAAMEASTPPLAEAMENDIPASAESFTADELDYAIAGYAAAVAKTAPANVAEILGSINNRSLRERIEEKLTAEEQKR